MRYRLFAAGSLLLLAFPLFSQQNSTQQALPPSMSPPSPQFTPPAPQPPVRDPQAVTILEASIKAMGNTPPSDSTATGAVSQAVGQQSQAT